MEADWTNCLPWGGIHPPHWRWGRARHLVHTGERRRPRVDDEWVAAARTALKHPGRRDRRPQDVRNAFELWSEDSPRRWELEALLLTAEPLDRIAGRVEVPPDVVTAYERVFYAVRGEPALAADWLQLQAIGYCPLTGFREVSTGGLWRLAGFAGGPILLDLVIATTTGGPLPPGFVTLTGREGEADESRVRDLTRLWINLATARTDEEFADMLRGHRALRAACPSPPVTDDPMLTVHQDLLLALPSLTRSAGRHPTEGRRDDEAKRHGRKNPPAPAVRRAAWRQPPG